MLHLFRHFPETTELHDPRVSLVIVGVGGTNGLAKCTRKDGSENGRIFFEEHKTRVVDGFEMNFVDARDVNGHFIFGLRNDDLDTLSKCQNGKEFFEKGVGLPSERLCRRVWYHAGQIRSLEPQSRGNLVLRPGRPEERSRCERGGKCSTATM